MMSMKNRAGIVSGEILSCNFFPAPRRNLLELLKPSSDCKKMGKRTRVSFDPSFALHQKLLKMLVLGLVVFVAVCMIAYSRRHSVRDE